MEGGILGRSFGEGTFTNAFYDSTTTGASDAGNGTGKTTAQMKTESTFTGWDFTVAGDGTIGDWIMAGYPHLQMEHRTSIDTPVQFQLMAVDLDEDYTLADNLDFTAITNYKPIGTFAVPFTGTLDGDGFLISNLVISQSALQSAGLFGSTSEAVTIQNVGYYSGSVTGNRFVGGIVGYNDGATLSNVFSNAVVTATTALVSQGEAGGLVGVNTGDGIIQDSYASSVVTSDFDVGGIAGYNFGTIIRTYSIGAVTGGTNMGGLVGRAEVAEISDSFSTVSVGAGDSVGGLVGALVGEASVSGSYWNDTGDVADCYQGGNAGCTRIDDDLTYFYDIENEPIGNWNFEEVWIDGLSNYPTLAVFGDITPPGVEITALELIPVGEQNYMTTNPITFVVTFTENVTGFDDLEELILLNGEATEIIQISPKVYQVSVTPDAQDDDGGIPVSLGFNQGVAQDGSGNLSGVDSPFGVIYDVVDPSGEFFSPSVADLGGIATANAPFVVTFHEDVDTDNFTVDDITVVNGRIYGFDVAVINTQFSFTLVPSNTGVVSLSIDQNKFTDVGGNNNSAIPLYSFAYTPASVGVGSANVSVGTGGGGGGGSSSSDNEASADTENDEQQSSDSESESGVANKDFPFEDLKDNFAKDAVAKLYELNVIQGRSATEYEPQAFLTRAEMTKIAVLIFGIPLENDSEILAQYDDLDMEEWYVPYIAAGTKNGFLKGYEDGTFRPNQPMTRAEALKVLVIASGVDLDGDFESPFGDVGSEDWFAKIVSYAYEQGIVKGKSAEVFAPNDLVTRGEMAVMTVNAYELSR